MPNPKRPGKQRLPNRNRTGSLRCPRCGLDCSRVKKDGKQYNYCKACFSYYEITTVR